MADQTSNNQSDSGRTQGGFTLGEEAFQLLTWMFSNGPWDMQKTFLQQLTLDEVRNLATAVPELQQQTVISQLLEDPAEDSDEISVSNEDVNEDSNQMLNANRTEDVDLRGRIFWILHAPFDSDSLSPEQDFDDLNSRSLVLSSGAKFRKTTKLRNAIWGGLRCMYKDRSTRANSLTRAVSNAKPCNLGPETGEHIQPCMLHKKWFPNEPAPLLCDSHSHRARFNPQYRYNNNIRCGNGHARDPEAGTGYSWYRSFYDDLGPSRCCFLGLAICCDDCLPSTESGDLLYDSTIHDSSGILKTNCADCYNMELIQASKIWRRKVRSLFEYTNESLTHYCLRCGDVRTYALTDLIQEVRETASASASEHLGRFYEGREVCWIHIPSQPTFLDPERDVQGMVRIGREGWISNVDVDIFT